MFGATIRVLLVMLPVAAAQAGPIDDIIRRENPCKGLALGSGPMRAGIDVTRNIDLGKFVVTADSDRINASLTGNLTCETGTNATLNGTLSFRIEADASIAAASCKPSAVVKLSGFGGSFASFGEAFRQPFEQLLTAEVKRIAERECRDFMGLKR